MQAHSRIKALDAVRGIAALLVVFNHATLTLTEHIPAPLFGAIGGRPSVIMFFVLSGYVLAHSLKRREEPFLGFAVRRLCRIWLPFAAAILVAALIRTAIDPHPVLTTTEIFNQWWRDPATPALVLRHLALTGSQPNLQLDNVAWSLVHELRISLVFPILFAVTVRWPNLALLSSLALHISAAVALGCNGHCMPLFSWSFLSAVAMTSYFVVFFVAGIWVSLRAELFSRVVSRVSPLAIGLCAIGLLSVHADLALLLGAMLAIGSTAAGAFDRVLLSPAPLWLGRVSYSLYLIHLIVLLALVHALHDYAPLWLILSGAVALSLVLSEGFYRLVEVNSQKLGKALGRRIAITPASAPIAPASRPQTTA